MKKLSGDRGRSWNLGRPEIWPAKWLYSKVITFISEGPLPYRATDAWVQRADAILVLIRCLIKKVRNYGRYNLRLKIMVLTG